MKREIKFRAKRVNGGEWVNSMTISHGTIKRKMYNVFFEVEPNKWVGVLPETVCQFSEITDKNGNSIFEHDLILIHDSESSYQFTVKYYFIKECSATGTRHVALPHCGMSAIDAK